MDLSHGSPSFNAVFIIQFRRERFLHSDVLMRSYVKQRGELPLKIIKNDADVN